jgi:intracellular sulfur oxidation DsrE/DsrF family protein
MGGVRARYLEVDEGTDHPISVACSDRFTLAAASFQMNPQRLSRRAARAYRAHTVTKGRIMKTTFPAMRVGVAVVLLALALPMQVQATEASASSLTWVHPVIADYGRVHPRPDAAVQPDPAVDYKVFVQVTGDHKHPTEALPALDRLARLVNLMGLSKVPASHVHIVALLDGQAGLASTTDSTYQQITKVAKNPNLPLIHALKQAGVQMLVCAQGLAEHNLPDSAVVPDVTVTLSALTDFVVYGQKGYSFMQL